MAFNAAAAALRLGALLPGGASFSLFSLVCALVEVGWTGFAGCDSDEDGVSVKTVNLQGYHQNAIAYSDAMAYAALLGCLYCCCCLRAARGTVSILLLLLLLLTDDDGSSWKKGVTTVKTECAMKQTKKGSDTADRQRRQGGRESWASP